jgi:hypothetical protein
MRLKYLPLIIPKIHVYATAVIMQTAANFTCSTKPLGICARNSSSREEPKPKDIAVKARFKLQRAAQKLLPYERIADCLRKPIPDANFVIGCFNPDSESSGFKNLQTCDSYSCPVCANKRAEQDRRKLSVAMAQAQAKGLHVIMVTFTLSHLVCSTLSATRKGLAQSYDAVFSGGWYQNLKDEYGIKGKIKAWESNYGRNGWHPHIHMLMFLEYELSPEQIAGFKKFVSKRYMKALDRRGFHASFQHGVDVRTAESDIADYIAKFGREPQNKTWGADSEIARIPAKKAALDGLTPFQLLAAADGDTDELRHLSVIHEGATDDELKSIAAALYVEYFKAMKRNPRIVWSDGLKEFLELDDALAELDKNAPDIHAADEWFYMIPVGDEWRKVTGRWNTPDLRGELLTVTRSGDKVLVHAWLLSRGIQHVMLVDTK